MNSTPTPHNSAVKGDITKTVIMAGDPLRCKMIAENFLTNSKLVNNVRGIQGYTGYYNGKEVTVMAHGMGNPSMGIYSYELYHFYDVDTIIRIGSIGALDKDIELQEIIVANSCYTSTNYNNFYKENGEGYIEATEKLVEKAKDFAKKLNTHIYVGNILCSDTFYTNDNQLEVAKQHHLLGVEMESAALYINAKEAKKNALTLCTVSDSLVTGEKLNSEDRQNSFIAMVKLALEMATNV